MDNTNDNTTFTQKGTDFTQKGTENGKKADSEDTVLDDGTQTGQADGQTAEGQEPKAEEQQPTEGVPAKADGGKKRTGWGRIAVAGGTGIVLGAAAATLTSFAPLPEDSPLSQHEDHNTDINGEVPEWSDGEVAIATSVNDDMSFSEAFAAARQEVGAGGAFEWHGNVYGTYYADEWNNMTPEEREEYGNHFNWNKLDEPDTQDYSVEAQEDVSHDTVEADYVETQSQQPVAAEAGMQQTADQEVEILGVEHDDDSGMNFAAVRVNNQDALLVDVDNDNEFDVLATDANDNGHLEDNEVIDISAHHISADDLGISFDGKGGDVAQADSSTDYIGSDDAPEA